MRRAVITGLGFISSIGNDTPAVLSSLREARTGIEPFADYLNDSVPNPITLVGTIKDFSFETHHFEDWTYPDRYEIPREHLRWMTPNSLMSFCSMTQAIEDAGFSEGEISNERTCLMTASAPSMWMAYENLHRMQERGVMRCPPMSVVNSIPGSLYINLGSIFRIKGGTMGFASACSSSAHALGMAHDLIKMGRQDRAFVVGAEDCTKHQLLGFATVRALSTQKDPAQSSRPFDKNRDGFVGTGGSAVLVVEEYEAAKARGATIYAEVKGWAQTSDGFNVMAPEPNGEGVGRSMELALQDAGLEPGDIDYINAHATSTPVGDVAELRAIKRVFAEGKRPYVSSTKALTGHGLSLAGALEAGISSLAIREKFTPVSAHITELDPEAEGVPVVTGPVDHAPRHVLSNSSGFGGTNVSLILTAVDS